MSAAGRLSAALICGPGQPGRRGRVGGDGQQVQRIGGGQVLERVQRGGEELPQRVTQPLHVAGPFPDQRLMRPGDDLDRLGQLGVAGDRAQLVRIGAHHVGQHVRVGRVALRTRHTVALPETRDLQRVDRVDPVAGRDQRLHPRATVGLDPHHHCGRPSRRSCQAPRRSSRATAPSPPRPQAAWPKPPDPSRPAPRHRDAPRPSHLRRTAHPLPPLTPRTPSAARGSTASDLMNECSRRTQRARHPISGLVSRPPAGARSLLRTTTSRRECSPAGGYRTESAQHAGQPSLVRRRRRHRALPGLQPG